MAQKTQTTKTQSRYSSMFWDIYARAYDKLLHIRPYQKYLNDIVNLLDPNAKVTVELGCGTGNVWLWANRILQLPEDFHVTLLDRSREMLEKAAQKLKNIRFPVMYKEADITNSLPFQDNSVDQVVIANALYAVQNPEQVLREILRILKPNGRFIVVDPDNSFRMSHILQAHINMPDGPQWEVENSFWKNFRILLCYAWKDEVLLKYFFSYAFIIYLNAKLGEKANLFYTMERLQEVLEKAGFDFQQAKKTYAGQNNIILAQPKMEEEVIL